MAKQTKKTMVQITKDWALLKFKAHHSYEQVFTRIVVRHLNNPDVLGQKGILTVLIYVKSLSDRMD